MGTMAWIRLQAIKKDGEGKIIAGSASIVDTVYDPNGKYHSKQITREVLGRPLELASDRKSGIFRTPEGAIVAYDSNSDTKEVLDMDDPRLEGLIQSVRPNVHTVFGDAYLFLNYLKNIGMTDILREVFPAEDDFQRCVAHLFHTNMRNASKDRCDLFLKKSFAGYVVPKVMNTSLVADTRYFDLMGDDEVRMSVFKGFVNLMRSSNPDFGRCCYIDSTPLPNDIDDNPFNAFSSHGDSGIQCRLILVADIGTGLPVWFKVIPGNVVDVNTLKNTADDVCISLGITIVEHVLDAGYASEDLIRQYSLGVACKATIRIDSKGNPVESVVINDDPELDDAEIPDKTMVVKMPFRAGYGHMDMFFSIKDLLNNGKYDFIREKHAYFGKRREVCLFGQRMYAYIYVDHNNALKGYRDFMSSHLDDFKDMKDKERTWKKYSSGFFVLLSNIREGPEEMLDRYFGRCFIESVFKTAKEYLDLLPLKKWTMQRVYGKLLSDMLSLIVYLNMRKEIMSTRYSLTEVITTTQALMCCVDSNDAVHIDPPSKQVKDIYKVFGIKLQNQFDLGQYIDEFMS